MLRKAKRWAAAWLAMALLGAALAPGGARAAQPAQPFLQTQPIPMQTDDMPRPTLESIQLLDFAGAGKGEGGLVYAYRKDSEFGHYYFLPEGYKLNQGPERDRINAPDGKSRLYVISQSQRTDEGITKKHNRLMSAFREVGIDPAGGSTGNDSPSSERHIDYAVRLNDQKGFRYRAALLRGDFNGKQLIVIEKTPSGSSQMRQMFGEIERSISNDIYDFDNIRVASDIGLPNDGQYFFLPDAVTVYLPDMQFAAVQGVRSTFFRYQPVLRRYFAADELPYIRVEEMSQRSADDTAASYAQKRAALVGEQLGFDPDDMRWSTFSVRNDPAVAGGARTVYWSMTQNQAQDSWFVSRIMYTKSAAGGRYTLLMCYLPTEDKSNAMSDISAFYSQSFADIA